MLEYKAERAGARLVEVDPRNTTQDCSGCGIKVPKGLGERVHCCPHCGLSIDRDLNAARNIFNRAGMGPGLQNVAGCGKRAGGNLTDSRTAYYEVREPERKYPTLLLYSSSSDIPANQNKKKGAREGALKCIPRHCARGRRTGRP